MYQTSAAPPATHRTGRLIQQAIAAFAAAVGLLVVITGAPAPAHAERDDADARGASSDRAPGKARRTTTTSRDRERPDLGRIPASLSARRAWVRTTERLIQHEGGEPSGPTKITTREERIAREIEALLRGPLRRGVTSLFVADADTGERIFAVFPDARLNPASNVKLVATAAALDILGPDHRYFTRVLGEAPDPAGTIASDLYLFGSYDPTLAADGIDDLAAQLAASGLKELTGDVVVGPARSRDGVFRSRIRVVIEPGAPGEAPRVTATPATDLVELVVAATTTRRKRVRGGLKVGSEDVVDAQGRARVRVTISGTTGRAQRLARTVWITERSLFAGHLLRAALRARGISVLGDVRVAEVRDYLDRSVERGFLPLPLAEHRSPPLADIVARVNKWSTNWLADRVIMTAAARQYGEKPSMERAIDAMYAWLARRTELGHEDLVIDTGSGLSYHTEMSSRQVVRVLRAALGYGDDDAKHAAELGPVRDAFRRSLAIGGKDGTIRGRFKELGALVLGKTGTLERVVALSGLLETPQQRRLLFSVITNGHPPRLKRRVRRAHEKLVRLLGKYLAESR